MTMRHVPLPLDRDMLEWLEDWTPPFKHEGPPLTLSEKVFLAVCLARVYDQRDRAADKADSGPVERG